MSRQGLSQASGELVLVQVGLQQFAIDVMLVREIRGWADSTRLPHAPAYVHGMINLRGAVLPVVDLGARLGLPRTQPDRSSVVVVAQIQNSVVGLLVDAVCDILLLKEEMIQAAPDVGSREARDFVQGVITTADGIVSILSLDHVLPQADLEVALRSGPQDADTVAA
ncbi:chemotaxis protein CheW [Phenylobacterium sp.]|uniref:chemotaxis protein CheW n=1 Tax=Phenylobacterium sp. TaxID=1871053 RepID=UPI003BA9F8C2